MYILYMHLYFNLALVYSKLNPLRLLKKQVQVSKLKRSKTTLYQMISGAMVDTNKCFVE